MHGAIDDLGAAVIKMGEDIAGRRRASRQEALTRAVPASVIHAVHVRADRLPAKIAAVVAHLLAVADPAV